MSRKEDQEWLIMRFFAESCTDFPKGRLVKGESPDFRLLVSRRQFIGIELTRVHRKEVEEPGKVAILAGSATSQVMESIRLKEEKARLYRSGHPHQLWLIIFADYCEAGTWPRLTRYFDHNQVDSTFDCIYFFNLENRAICRLK